jgi:archaellum biogenesis ATPase FlaH
VRALRPQLVTDLLAEDEEWLLRAARRNAAQNATSVHAIHDTGSVNTVNTDVGLFTCRPMGAWLSDASKKPVPRKLCGDVWAEGELVIFFGSTGDGKTAFAVQIADGITKGGSSTGLTMDAASQSVAYIDFELSDCQQLRRYAIEKRNSDGSLSYDSVYEFDEKFQRIEVNSASQLFDRLRDWEATLLIEVERIIVESKAKVVIVDNITWLSRETDKGKFALPLMQRLCDLKKQHGLSVLVLAHTPKRDETRPLSLNDLAGSRILANFADSVFAIGKSSTNSRIRYLKQLKVRSAEMVHSADNVAVFQLEKTGNFLGFTFMRCSSESEHLRILTDNARDELIDRARQLRADGKTQREIAKEMEISLGAVNKYLKLDSVQNREQRERCEQDERREHEDEHLLRPGASAEEAATYTARWLAEEGSGEVP